MRWEFKQEPRAPHRWRWQRVDSESGSVSMISDALFKTLQECVRDAEKNGYVAPGATAVLREADDASPTARHES